MKRPGFHEGNEDLPRENGEIMRKPWFFVEPTRLNWV
jgi:hypothetical protein